METEIFLKSIEDKFETIRDWNISKIKYKKIAMPGVTLHDKKKIGHDIVKKLFPP